MSNKCICRSKNSKYLAKHYLYTVCQIQSSLSVQPVAFSARMFAMGTTFPSQKAVPYSLETTDTAGAYSNYRFTAPSPGVYFFTWSVTSLPDNPVDTVLMKNVTIIGKLSCHSFSKADKRNTCSQSTVVQLKSGDVVWVKATAPIGLLSRNNWPMFSGFKL